MRLIFVKRQFINYNVSSFIVIIWFSIFNLTNSNICKSNYYKGSSISFANSSIVF